MPDIEPQPDDRVPMKSNDTMHRANLTDIEPNSLYDWALEHGSKLIYGAIIALVLLIAILWFSYGSTARSESQFFETASVYTSLQNGNKEALPKISALLMQTPELQAQYDGLIAQTLLNQRNVEEARPFANRTFERTSKDSLPMYQNYAETTLLISSGDHATALKRAQTLQSQMLEEFNETKTRSFGDALFAFNLMRIAILQQLNGQPEAETLTWTEWKHYALADQSVKGHNVDKRIFDKLQNELHVGNVTLANYIESRTKPTK